MYTFTGRQTLTASDSGFPSGADPSTLLFWFNSSSGGSMSIFGYGGGGANYRLAMATGSALAADVYGEMLAAPNYADGNWHKCVIVFSQDGAGLSKIFVDGALVATGTLAIDSALGQVAVGARPVLGAALFTGSVANCAVFATGLSDADAEALSANAAPDASSAANCLSFWPLSSQTDLADTSGHSNTLTQTLSGLPWDSMDLCSNQITPALR